MTALRIGGAALVLALGACTIEDEPRMLVVPAPAVEPIVLHPPSPGLGQPAVTYVEPPSYGDVTFVSPEVQTEPLEDLGARNTGGAWVLPD